MARGDGVGPPERQAEACVEACTALDQMDGFHGVRNVIIKGDSPLMLPDGQTLEDQVWPNLQFNSLCVSGYLGMFKGVSMLGSPQLLWSIRDSQVLDTPETLDPFALQEDAALDFDYYLPVEHPVRRALYFPVNLIDYVLCAK